MTTEPAHPAVARSIQVRGNPTPDEVAALVVVLTALSGDSGPAPEDTGSRWASHRAAVRAPVSPGPGAWRSATRS